ncbi:MAG: hypothetical protein JO102_04175, partial [Elusimicrobia bacterium]|nr:hypothetical protein [Elusimicrobiota bacterium]
VLKGLVSDKGVRLIGVEGAFGPFDFAPFRDGSAKETAEMAEAFLHDNRIAAPSYLGLTLPEPQPKFVGVDERASYDTNRAAYLHARLLQKSVDRSLETLHMQFAMESSRRFPARLVAFQQLKDQQERGKIGIAVYVRQLMTFPIEPEFALERFSQAAQIETSLNFDVVDRERRAVIERLAARLSGADLRRLLDLSLGYRAGRLSFGAYYNELRGMCQGAGISLANYPAFDDFIRYALLADGIDADELFDAIRASERQIVKALARTPAERAFADLCERERLTEKLVKFELSPSDWQTYRSLKVDSREPLAAALNKLPLGDFEMFYSAADRRSHAIVDALLREIGSSTAPAILVAGGFHTPDVSRLLREKGVSHAIVTPRLTKADTAEGSAYLSVFAREKTPLDKLFVGEKLFLAPSGLALANPGSAEAAIAEGEFKLFKQGRHDLGERTGTVSETVTTRAKRTVSELVSNEPGPHAGVDSSLPVRGQRLYLLRTRAFAATVFALRALDAMARFPAMLAERFFAALRPVAPAFALGLVAAVVAMTPANAIGATKDAAAAVAPTIWNQWSPLVWIFVGIVALVVLSLIYRAIANAVRDSKVMDTLRRNRLAAPRRRRSIGGFEGLNTSVPAMVEVLEDRVVPSATVADTRVVTDLAPTINLDKSAAAAAAAQQHQQTQVGADVWAAIGAHSIPLGEGFNLGQVAVDHSDHTPGHTPNLFDRFDDMAGSLAAAIHGVDLNQQGTTGAFPFLTGQELGAGFELPGVDVRPLTPTAPAVVNPAAPIAPAVQAPLVQAPASPTIAGEGSVVFTPEFKQAFNDPAVQLQVTPSGNAPQVQLAFTLQDGSKATAVVATKDLQPGGALSDFGFAIGKIQSVQATALDAEGRPLSETVAISAAGREARGETAAPGDQLYQPAPGVKPANPVYTLVPQVARDNSLLGTAGSETIGVSVIDKTITFSNGRTSLVAHNPIPFTYYYTPTGPYSVSGNTAGGVGTAGPVTGAPAAGARQNERAQTPNAGAEAVGYSFEIADPESPRPENAIDFQRVAAGDYVAKVPVTLEGGTIAGIPKGADIVIRSVGADGRPVGKPVEIRGSDNKLQVEIEIGTNEIRMNITS